MRRIGILMSLVLFSVSIESYSQEYKRITNLPAIYIKTFDNAPINSKTNYIYCTMWYVDEEDNVTKYDSVSIRGRGNSTWGLAKKPYKIKFNNKEKFLGKGYAKAKKWTLLANAGDKSLIRNAITNEMGTWLGMKNCPANKFVDMTVNDVFLGNYQISDQVEVRPHRVNITEQDYPLTEESDITGGYLLEVDGFHDGNCFASSKGVYIRIHYPDEDEIVAEQKNYIRNYINSFENALFSEDFTDPQKGYRVFVDSLSMANLYIVNEVAANIDGFYSTYFYKDQQDSLLYFGPIWDNDISYSNDYRKTSTVSQLMVDDGYGDARKWFRQMWNDSKWFAKFINNRFEEAVENGLEEFLYQKIDSLTELLAQSQELNYNKWGIRNRMYHEINLYSTYDDYIYELKAFIHNHLSYLQTAFAERKPVEPTPPFKPDNFYYHIISAKSNNALDILDNNDTPYSEYNLPHQGALIVSWNENEERLSQNWKITPVGEYFFITNQLLDLALNDPTPGNPTATTEVGTQLNIAEPDSTDFRQLWIITPQGTQGYYNLTNAFTQHTANLSGGGNANGTGILSYTTDSRNASSVNRLWYIKKTDIELPEPPEPSGIFAVNATVDSEYALVYNYDLKELRFAGENPDELNFTAYIYTADGNRIASFNAAKPYSIEALPSAVYVVSWMVNGRIKSAKVAR